MFTGSREPLPLHYTWTLVARVRLTHTILVHFMWLLFSLVMILYWRKMTSWKPPVLLMRPGIGQIRGLARQARNSCEL